MILEYLIFIPHVTYAAWHLLFVSFVQYHYNHYPLRPWINQRIYSKSVSLVQHSCINSMEYGFYRGFGESVWGLEREKWPERRMM